MKDTTTSRDNDKAEALGDTGDGNTGVPADEQGISNRPGDQDDGEEPEDEEDEDDEELEEDEDGEDDEDDEFEEDADEIDEDAKPKMSLT